MSEARRFICNVLLVCLSLLALSLDDVLLQQHYEFVHLVGQLLVGHYLVVDIDQREHHAEVVLLKERIKVRLAAAPAFACEAAHTVAVHGVVEATLGRHNHHLAGCVRGWQLGLFRWYYEPLYAEGKRHEAVAIGVEPVHQAAAAQPFLFAKGSGHYFFLAEVVLVALAAGFAVAFAAVLVAGLALLAAGFVAVFVALAAGLTALVAGFAAGFTVFVVGLTALVSAFAAGFTALVAAVFFAASFSAALAAA